MKIITLCLVCVVSVEVHGGTLSLGDVQQETAKLKKEYGSELTSAQLDALKDDLSKWANGRLVEMEVRIRDVEVVGEQAILSFDSLKCDLVRGKRGFEPDIGWESRLGVPGRSKQEALKLSKDQVIVAQFKILCPADGRISEDRNATLRYPWTKTEKRDFNYMRLTDDPRGVPLKLQSIRGDHP